MAWSDAARAAALEVRRQHMAAKKKLLPMLQATTPISRYNLSNSVYRGNIAYALKGLRRGDPAYKGVSVKEAVRAAINSTYRRNLSRKRRTRSGF